MKSRSRVSALDERRVKARGLCVQDTHHLCTLYNCNLEQLLAMYKIRKTMIIHPVAKAQVWLRRNRSSGCNQQVQQVHKVYHNISSVLETWVPTTKCSNGDVVEVMGVDSKTYKIRAEHHRTVSKNNAAGAEYTDVKIKGTFLSEASLTVGNHVIEPGTCVSFAGSNVCGVVKM